MISLFSVLVVAYLFTLLAVPWLIPRLMKSGLTGRDMNKAENTIVAEMGGLAIVGGFVVGVLLAIGLSTFNFLDEPVRLPYVLAGLSVILITALIGVIDDLLLLDQRVKALLPVFASLPLIAVKAGVTTMNLPLLGTVDFGLLYPLILVPIAITGASNATNMLAGFNGLEAGLGIVMCATVGLVGYQLGRVEAVILSFAMLGSLLAFMKYNWNPAKILPGDVGTLSIGAVIACAVIIGDFEQVGFILFIPYFLELFLKASSGFKAQSWCKIKDGLLVCDKGDKIHGVGRLFMRLYGGVTETKLVATILLVEVFFAGLAVSSMSGVIV
jgi:UDP-N-acetylglucosamine--dolichyl-phosphate N-acetylglucosaminephosphotransferase